MKNIKYVAVVVTLCLAIVFLVMDKCGSSRKADELKGQYREAREISEVERRIKEETIREQKEKIETLDATIVVLNTTIAKKEENIGQLGDTIADLEDEFSNLTDKDEKITNLVSQVSTWKEKFTLSQGIIKDKDSVIFNLNKKYKSQVVISLSWEESYKSIQRLVQISEQQVKELEKINRRLKLTSGLKTGIVLTMAGVVLYSLLKD